MESVLAGGNGDGGIQLRPDGGGAFSSAGEQLAVATAVRHRLWTAMGSRFLYIRPFIRIYLNSSIFGPFNHIFGLMPNLTFALVIIVIVGQ